MFPANEQLYDNIVKQARAKWPPKNPSSDRLVPAANEFINRTYASEGGTFVASKQDADPKLIDKDREARRAQKAKEQRQKSKKKASGLL